MLKHLENCQDRTKLPRFLGPHVTIAHKTGALATVRTDAGIISSPSGPLVICVLTSENKDQRWTAENASEILCARVAKITCSHFDQGTKRGDSREICKYLEELLVAVKVKSLRHRCATDQF